MEPLKKQAFSPAELAMIKRYLLGGVAAGGGIGTLLGVGNMARDLMRQQEVDTSEDDDTLYLNVPGKQASSVGPVAIGSGMAGGALSFLLMHALARKAYQSMKRRDVQAELDSVQRANLAAIDPEREKEAGTRPLGPTEALGGGAVALALLTALASGAISYKALGKYFPAVKKPQSPLPRRVKVVTQPPASADPTLEEEKQATEFNVRFALTSKQAACGSLGDLVAAVAQGRCDELEAIAPAGADSLFALCKGAHKLPSSPRSFDDALRLVVESPVLRKTAGTLAAAEVYDRFPTICKIAGSLEPDDSEALVLFGAGALQKFQPLEKPAAAGGASEIRLALRRRILAENEKADPRELKTLQEQMTRGELLSGTSGESVEGDDADTSRQHGSVLRDVPEAVMGVQ